MLYYDLNHYDPLLTHGGIVNKLTEGAAKIGAKHSQLIR